MRQFFDFYGNYEIPDFILCNPDSTELNFLITHNRKFIWRYNDTSELTFDYYYTGENSKIYDLIEVKRLIFLTDIGYFQIQNITEHDDGISKYKSITAHSIQNELGFKKILILAGTYKFYDPLNMENTFMGMILDASPGWGIGDIDSAMWNKYRTFDDTDTNVLDLLYNDGSKAYGCIFTFDFINRKISATAVTTITQNPNRTDIYISFENLVKSIEIQEKSDNIYTAISAYGKDLDIRYVNPIGTNFIYNFSHYMTEEWMPLSLINAIKAWNLNIEENRANYVDLLDSLMNLNAELVTLQSELTDLGNEYKEYDVIRSSRISQGLDYSDINTRLNSIQSSIDSKKVEITAKSTQITNISAQISNIAESLKMENNFTEDEFLRLQYFITATTYTNTNYIVTDSMTPDVIQMYAQELYYEAEDELARLSQPSYTFTVDAANFIFLQEYGIFTSQLEPGCMIYVEKDENNVFFPVLLEVVCPWDDPDSFSMTFGNRYRMDDSEATFGDLTSELSKTSSILGLNSGKWDNFNRNYKNSVSSLINDAFDTARNEIINSSNQEIVIDASGLLGRKLKTLSEGETLGVGESPYEDEQLKIIHNKLVFTDDGWDSIKTILGKILLGSGFYAYGLAAEAILGKLFVGDQLVITNENNSFYVDGSGARLYNADFTIENDVSRITLSPDTGISIQKKLSSSTYEDIFYVDEEGEAFFKGNITAYSGVLGGWTIEPNGLSHSSGIYYLRSDGTGRIGLMTFTNTSATFDGNIYAKNLQAGNTILSDGSYGNAGYVGDGHIADNSISGTKLRAEYRDSIVNSIAEIKVYADNTFATISSFTQFQSNVNNQIINTKTSIEQTAAATYATISSLAQYQNATNSSIASITQDVQENGARIALVVGTGKLVDNAGNASGSIIVSAINGSSSAIISADKIDLHGYVTFTNLSASGQTTINGGNLINDSVSTDKLTSSNNQIIFNKHLLFNNPSFSEIAQVSNIYFRNGVNMYASNAGSETVNFVSGYGGSITLKVNGNTVLHSGNYQNYISSATAKFG